MAMSNRGMRELLRYSRYEREIITIRTSSIQPDYIINIYIYIYIHNMHNIHIIS